MRSILTAAVLAAATLPAFAVQETFTTAGPLDCSAIRFCTQTTDDGLFTLRFTPTYPTSGPDTLGYEVRQSAVEIRPAAGGVLDLGSMAVALTGSKSYNGMNFIGAVRLDTQDVAGTWTTASQWSSWINSPQGIYVIFNGFNPQSPKIQGVQAVRLVAVNGATAFRIGMMNLTAR